VGRPVQANATYHDSPFASRNSYFRTGDDFRSSIPAGSKRGEVGLHWVGPIGGIELETLAAAAFRPSTDLQIQTASATTKCSGIATRTMESIARATLRYASTRT
jgi:hypothetical protein